MTKGVFGKTGPSDEIVEKIRLAVEDGWPMGEIIETYKVSHRTIKKLHPDYKGVTGFRILKREFEGAHWNKMVA
jgi:hypothetical protein